LCLGLKQVVELPTCMRPAAGFQDAPVFVQPIEPTEAVGLQDPRELRQVRPRMRSFPRRRVPVPGCWGIRAPRRPIVTNLRPEPRGFCRSPSGVEHRHRSVVGVDLGTHNDVAADLVNERGKRLIRLRY